MCSNTFSQNTKACVSFHVLSHIVHNKETDCVLWYNAGIKCLLEVLCFTLPIICFDYCISFLSDNIPRPYIIEPGVLCRLWLCQPQQCLRTDVYVPVASKPCFLSNITSPEVTQLAKCWNQTLSVPVSVAEAEFLQLHSWKCFSSERTNEEISH